jgi:hypothetical protein
MRQETFIMLECAIHSKAAPTLVIASTFFALVVALVMLAVEQDEAPVGAGELEIDPKAVDSEA